jgi:hypothetical protein
VQAASVQLVARVEETATAQQQDQRVEETATSQQHAQQHAGNGSPAGTQRDPPLPGGCSTQTQDVRRSTETQDMRCDVPEGRGLSAGDDDGRQKIWVEIELGEAEYSDEDEEPLKLLVAADANMDEVLAVAASRLQQLGKCGWRIDVLEFGGRALRPADSFEQLMRSLSCSLLAPLLCVLPSVFAL